MMNTFIERARSALLGSMLMFGIAATVAAHGEHAPAQNPTPAKTARLELAANAAIAPDGTWYAVALRDERLVLYRSADEGRHWADVAMINREPEAIAADGENRPRLAFATDGAVLVSWARRFKERFTGDVRFARSADGLHFDAPVTVHRDRSITAQSFNAMRVMSDGRLVLAWIDGRDSKAARQAGTDYRGSAIYTAQSDDGGRSFHPEVKLADHSCQCCRLAITEDVDSQPLILWRHVFEPNERDHALAKLGPDGRALSVVRATFDRWQIDACPHHGPSLAIAADGTRHAVWFNHRDGEGRAYYGRLIEGSVDGQRTVGGARAAHADIAVSGERVVIVWKEFDGERTRLFAEASTDGGRQFSTHALAATEGASDQPQLIHRGATLFAFWRTENEGMKGYALP